MPGKIIKVSVTWLLIEFFGILVTACGPTQNSATVPIIAAAATPSVVPNTSTLTPTSAATSVPATATPILNVRPLVAPIPLNRQVNGASQIFLGQVVNIGVLIWDTPDNEEPVDFNPVKLNQKYSKIPQQFAPVEINIKTVYKGSAKPDEKIVLLLGGAPNSKPYGGSETFPKIGDQKIWFVGNSLDYRNGKGKTPLVFPAVNQFFTLQADGSWQGTDTSIFTTAQLENTIKNPVIDPTRPPVTPKPTATPRAKPGEAVNLVQLYKLDTTKAILVKGVPSAGFITDASQIKTVIAALDRTALAQDTSKPENEQATDILVYLVFQTAEGDFSFWYNKNTGYISRDERDALRLPASPELAKALGL
jgi:hypothetical protein